jgi:hypothetical protein
MKRIKHLLSEPAEWITKSEFVDKSGNLTSAIGETKIIVDGANIKNETWICIDGKRIGHFYNIEKESDNRFLFKSDNQKFGKETGEFNIIKNVVYSKFVVDNSSINGFEIFIKEEDECSVYGTLYDGTDLIHSWKSVMVRI